MPLLVNKESFVVYNVLKVVLKNAIALPNHWEVKPWPFG